MPVIPYRTNLFQNKKDLYQFLLTCQTAALAQAHPQIASISLALPPVDPLVVLQALARSDALHFYWEKGNQRFAVDEASGAGNFLQNLAKQPMAMVSVSAETYMQREAAPLEHRPLAIAAIDAAVYCRTEGGQRFSTVKNFIDAWLPHTITLGDTQLPLAGPHFFCSFTFFDDGDRFPGATVFLPRWQIARQGDQSVLVANVLVTASSAVLDLTEDVWQTLETILNLPMGAIAERHVREHRFSSPAEVDRETFKAAVLAALTSIEAGHFHKIVLAHAVDVKRTQPIQLFPSLDHLRRLYPDCYVFSVSNQTGQTFIGASPERLLKLSTQGLITDALAGSAPRGKTAAEDAYLANALLHSPKDRYEHQVVTDFITQCLLQLGLQPQLSTSPHLFQLPNIQHLRTVIRTPMTRTSHLLEILAALHPTPAVAGAPRQITCQHIRRHETFERDLFGAPLGWVDYQGHGEFIVGIRSALIDGNRARLYAGAGIVAASDPDKEVAEIQLKLQVLLGALI